MIAALYVQPGGAYFGLPDVDPWDEARDARRYAGPWPVVAHPPCQRWSRLAGQVEQRGGKKRGDDGGCFASALAAVRTHGGILEHPAGSAAWKAHGLREPVGIGVWTAADLHGGWTAYVDQGHYGHRCAKPTWFYACGVDLPDLPRTEAPRRNPGSRVGEVQLLSKRQRIETPPAFRDLLLSIARTARALEPA